VLVQLRRRAGRWAGALALASLLLLGACGAPARDRFLPADTPIDPYAAVRAQADEYYRQGLEQYRQGQYSRALENFQRAKLHDPGPRPEVEEMIRLTQEAIASGRAAPVPTGAPRSTPGAVTAPVPTPVSLPLQSFVSRAYNYAILYPVGWRAEGASLRVGSTLLDAYTEERDGGATAIVFGFPPAAGASQDALVRESLALRQKAGTPYRRLGVRPVDDTQAVLVTYTEQRADGAWLAVRQAVFQRSGLCWVVAVAAPLPDAPRYAGVLDQMLDGFKVGPGRA
jgi:hypothetical protein